jgi:hypothetical protein
MDSRTAAAPRGAAEGKDFVIAMINDDGGADRIFGSACTSVESNPGECSVTGSDIVPNEP